MADLPLDHVRNKFKKRFQEAARRISGAEPPAASFPHLSVVFPNQPPPAEPPKENELAATASVIEREVRFWVDKCRSLENELAAARESIHRLEEDLRAALDRKPDEGLRAELRRTEGRLEEQSRVTRVLDEKLRQAEERAAAAERSSLNAGKNAPPPGQSDVELQDLRTQLEESRTQRASLRESFRRAEQEASSWRQRFADLEDRFARQGKELAEMRTLFQTAREELDKLRSGGSGPEPEGPMPDIELEIKPSDRSVILNELEIKFNRQSKVLREVQRAKEELEQKLAKLKIEAKGQEAPPQDPPQA